MSFRVKRVLESATDLTSAVELIRQHFTSGHWSVLVTHGPTDCVQLVDVVDGQVTSRPVSGMAIAVCRDSMSVPVSDAHGTESGPMEQIARLKHHTLKSGLASETALSVLLRVGAVEAGTRLTLDRVRAWTLTVNADHPGVITYRADLSGTSEEIDLKEVFANAAPAIAVQSAHIASPSQTARPLNSAHSHAKVSERGKENGSPSQHLDRNHFDGALLRRGAVRAAGAKATSSLLLDPDKDSFLAEHRLRDKPLLPAVIALELFVETALSQPPAEPLAAVRNFEIANGLWFQDNQPRRAVVTADCAAGVTKCRLESDRPNFESRGQSPLNLHATGEVLLGDPKGVESVAVGSPLFGWMPFVYPDSAGLYHGPSLRCLKQFSFRHRDGWAQLTAPASNHFASTQQRGTWVLPSSLLDGCLVACGTFSYTMLGQRLEIPQGMGYLRFGRQPRPGEACVLRLTAKPGDTQSTSFDFVLVGDDHTVLFEATDYRTLVITKT